jgi:CheY-like chemotaxis protein
VTTARILLIDDDPLVTEMYTLALTRAGHEVVSAGDGPRGLQVAAGDRPDLIFLDVKMPRMDGIEVLTQLSQDAVTRAIPVVMLSNYDDRNLVRQAESLGAKQYLVKAGTNPSDLAAVVERWHEAPPPGGAAAH